MSGLHYDSTADMPSGMRRQLVVKIIARRVAAEVSEEERQRRKKVRRLQALKDAALEGAITDLKVDHNLTLRDSYTTPEGIRIPCVLHTVDFSYKVNLPLNHWPCCCDIRDLEFWSEIADTCGPGTMVVEDIPKPADETEEGREILRLMAERGYLRREV